MSWSDVVALEQFDTHRFRATAGDEWSSLQGVHGGYVAALAVTAAERVLTDEGVEPGTSMRAATFGYVSGNRLGELELDVEIVRRGRAMITSHVRVAQEGRTTTVARLHHSTPWDGPAYSDAPPRPERPVEPVRLDTSGRANHLSNVDTLLHPATTVFAGADRSEWLAWCRPRHGSTIDSSWLTMFGDYFPPSVFTRVTGPNRAVTIEYSIQIHGAAGSWVLADDEELVARMHTFHSADGFAVEDGWIWRADGELLATTRQTRLAG